MGTEKQAKESLILLKILNKLVAVKKIGVVVDSINVNDSSGSKANVALILNLKEAGFEVKVFHYTQKEIQLSNIECFSIAEKKGNGIYILSRIQRLFSRWMGINLNPLLEGFFGFSFTFFNDVASIKKALLKESDFNPDLIITLSKGASFRPHYALLKIPELHKKWMAYVHDPYPFHYYPRPYNWIEPGYQKKENFFRAVSEKAAYSAFPSLLLKEWMGSYFPNFLKTGLEIPHQNSEAILHKNKLPNYFESDKFTLLHAGNLMQERLPNGLIEGFKLFLKQNPLAKKNARLYLIGNASCHKELLQRSVQEISQLFVKPENETFESVYLMQQAASVNIILESKSEISPFLPGKFPHCVAANKPILALGPYYSEIRRLLGNNYPYWSEVDDIENISKKIEALYVLWFNNNEYLKLDREDILKYLGTKHLKRVIENVLENV